MRRLVLALMLGVVAALLFGGAHLAASDPPGIRWAKARFVAPTDGVALYDAYCRACHGPAGRGDGPVARRLPAAVPDLATIAVRDGRFDEVAVRIHITDRNEHRLMPDWGDILLAVYANRAHVTMAEVNLVEHLMRLQVQAAAR